MGVRPVPSDGVVFELADRDADERPDTVHIGEVEMDTSEFVNKLNAVADAAESLTRLESELDALRATGLTEQDIRDLLYGRNSSLNKTTIEAVQSTLGEVESDMGHGSGRRELLIRLVADVSGEGIKDTQEVFDELDRLNDKYGDDK